MPLPVATATTLVQTILGLSALTLPAALWLASYALACWLHPFTHCRFCHGTGTRHSRLGPLATPCRHCDATGLRLRIGRRVYNHFHRLHQEGSR